MGDAHEVIIHNIGKVIGRQAVGLQQDLVLHLFILHGDIAKGDIVERRRAGAGDLLADDVGRTARQLFLDLRRAQLGAAAGMLGDGGAALGGSAVVTFLAEAVVRAAFFDEKLCVFAEEVLPLGLDIGADGAADIGAFVVIQAALGHGVVDDVDRAFDQAALVRILNAQDKFAAGPAGDEPGIQGRAKIADMHIAGGAGRKPGADLAPGDARFHLVKEIHVLGTSEILRSAVILHFFTGFCQCFVAILCKMC